jgi:hypothetical protein
VQNGLSASLISTTHSIACFQLIFPTLGSKFQLSREFGCFHGCAETFAPRDLSLHEGDVFKYPDVDAIYMLGGGWRILEIVPLLERILGFR